MNPGTFKPRKESLRTAYAKKLKAEGTKTTWDRNGKPMKRKPIKKVAKSRREQMKTYLTVRREFLDANPDCFICVRRREDGEDIIQQPSTEVHHRNGRCGRKLCDTSDFIASCRDCREWPHQHPNKARELGILR